MMLKTQFSPKVDLSGFWKWTLQLTKKCTSMLHAWTSSKFAIQTRTMISCLPSRTVWTKTKDIPTDALNWCLSQTLSKNGMQSKKNVYFNVTANCKNHTNPSVLWVFCQNILPRPLQRVGNVAYTQHRHWQNRWVLLDLCNIITALKSSVVFKLSNNEKTIYMYLLRLC